ncbi:hypothetical protein BDD12DRAFT_322355 [Trichophaea hybrida]|nr:hypothetical protein BDD12DRAFT_322355 [Trichophaea hybrida]
MAIICGRRQQEFRGECKKKRVWCVPGLDDFYCCYLSSQEANCSVALDPVMPLGATRPIFHQDLEVCLAYSFRPCCLHFRQFIDTPSPRQRPPPVKYVGMNRTSTSMSRPRQIEKVHTTATSIAVIRCVGSSFLTWPPARIVRYLWPIAVYRSALAGRECSLSEFDELRRERTSLGSPRMASLSPH